ncbi:EF-hand calcium-binding domain-containing protein 4A-like [Diretmus argenteus]
MSNWLNDGEVLVGHGSGEVLSPRQNSPRQKSPRQKSPRSAYGRGLTASPTREVTPGALQPETMSKARELFVLCDKEGKGFITKRDMQRLQGELPLSPEQLETVFESLDRESNGFLTPVEFNTGLGEMVGREETMEQSHGEAAEDEEQVDWTRDPSAVNFMNRLMEIGADKLFKDQWELCSLWCELQRDRPEMISVLEDILAHAVSHLQDSLRERDSLEVALRRRESEHDRVVRSIYEEMEYQVREEKEKQLSQESIRQWDRGKQLEEELKLREHELESSLTKQRELETRLRQLSHQQVDIREKNQHIESLNLKLQEQLETSREALQTSLAQLNLVQLNAAQERRGRERDMNKRLRDEKDAHQAQKRTRIVRPQRVFKVVFLGNSGVGKTSFIHHYCTGHFSSTMSATVGIDFQMKTLTLGSTTIVLQLWDTAGQERFRSVTENYYRKADGILTVYDITDFSSFTAVRGWMDSVQEKKCEGTVLMLLGNKLDLADRRKVTTREGQRLAEQHQAVFYECSAKNGYSMEELITQLAG